MASPNISLTYGMRSALLVLAAVKDVRATATLDGRDDDVEITGASTDCHDVHIFIARGNNEEIGTASRQGVVVEAVCDGRDSCGWEDIYYDNPTDNEYAVACYEGAINGQNQIRSYAQNCSDARLVLTGFSQGAHVVGDILGGGGGTFETLGGGEYQGQNSTEGWIVGFDRESSPGIQIVAAFLFGDTRHTPNQSYNLLNGSAYAGWYPRNETELANLDAWSDVLLSWCHSLDRACAYDAAEHNDTYHLNYLSGSYPEDAADWLAVQLGEKASIDDDSSVAGVRSAAAGTSTATSTFTSTSATGTSSGTSESASSDSESEQESVSSAVGAKSLFTWLAFVGSLGFFLM